MLLNLLTKVIYLSPNPKYAVEFVEQNFTVKDFVKKILFIPSMIISLSINEMSIKISSFFLRRMNHFEIWRNDPEFWMEMNCSTNFLTRNFDWVLVPISNSNSFNIARILSNCLQFSFSCSNSFFIIFWNFRNIIHNSKLLFENPQRYN